MPPAEVFAAQLVFKSVLREKAKIGMAASRIID
jgi:hypothetical protein